MATGLLLHQVLPKEAAAMYYGQTCRGTTVQPVDGDRTFGNFMLAALEDGGEDVEWTSTDDGDDFLDRVGDIVAQARRKRATRATRGGSGHSGMASDKSGPKSRPRIELVLYTSPASDKCQKAIRAVRQVLDLYNVSQVHFRICDVAQHPKIAEEDAVVFTPTLVKRGPGPRTWLIGNLDQAELLVDLLDVSGVDRRRD